MAWACLHLYREPGQTRRGSIKPVGRKGVRDTGNSHVNTPPDLSPFLVLVCEAHSKIPCEPPGLRERAHLGGIPLATTAEMTWKLEKVPKRTCVMSKPVDWWLFRGGVETAIFCNSWISTFRGMNRLPFPLFHFLSRQRTMGDQAWCWRCVGMWADTRNLCSLACCSSKITNSSALFRHCPSSSGWLVLDVLFAALLGASGMITRQPQEHRRKKGSNSKDSPLECFDLL